MNKKEIEHKLSQENIHIQTFKYLIGELYMCEKNSNNNIANIYKAKKIGEKYNLHLGTVQKYEHYSRALDIIAKKDIELFNKFFMGDYIISHDNALKLSRIDDLKSSDLYYKIINTKRRCFTNRKLNIIVGHKLSQPDIKKMPQYDPDSEITSLFLTIPAWINSIKRVKDKTNFQEITDTSRNKLLPVLIQLEQSIYEIITEIEEGV